MSNMVLKDASASKNILNLHFDYLNPSLRGAGGIGEPALEKSAPLASFSQENNYFRLNYSDVTFTLIFISGRV